MSAQMEDHVLQCFNDMPMDEDDVDVLIDRVMQEDGDDWRVACKELKKIYVSMQASQAKSVARGARGAGYAIRECMDAAFVQHLGLTTPVENLFGNQTSHRWQRALLDYYQQLIEDLPKVIESIPQTEEPFDDEERESLASLKWCVAKIKVLRCVIEISDVEKSKAAVPFLSRSVYSHMAKKLELIEDALKEVRSTIVTVTPSYTKDAHSPHFSTRGKCGKHTIS